MIKINYLYDEMEKNYSSIKQSNGFFKFCSFIQQDPLTSKINYEDRELTPKFFKEKNRLSIYT